jgi:hypothetical protein
MGNLLREYIYTVLSAFKLSLIADVMLGAGRSPLTTIASVIPNIRSWADVSEAVGARREDFDRVRHAASGLQQDLPRKKARGEF